MSDPRYPVGKLEPHYRLETEQRHQMIEQIAATPANLRGAINGLDDRQLDTPYRDGGWTLRQVVHHVPESHMNAYMRLKFALTEDEPTIKPYDEAKWADTPEVGSTPIDASLSLLDSLTTRWVVLMRALPEEQFARRFRHPDHGIVTVDWLVTMYAWHGRHHVAHITSLRDRMRW